MSAQPVWSSVDDETADLLALVANDEMTPQPAEEWEFFCRSLREASTPFPFGALVDPNAMRSLVRGHIAPRRIGAFTNRAKAEGLIEDTGEWQVSDDTEGRNAGRPCRVYRLVGVA